MDRRIQHRPREVRCPPDSVRGTAQIECMECMVSDSPDAPTTPLVAAVMAYLVDDSC